MTFDYRTSALSNLTSCDPVADAPPYVALLARHQQQLRRDAELSTRARRMAARLTWTALLGLLVVCCPMCPIADARPSRDDMRDDNGDDDRDDEDRDTTFVIDPRFDVDESLVPGSRTRTAPPIAEVLDAAYDAAGLDRDPTKSWIRRARVAGLIPWVSVKTGWDQSWHDDEPGDVGRSRTFEVRATWRLDRLLFDGRELQMSSIDMARRRERRKLASRVIRAYFIWRKVMAVAANGSGRGGLAVEAATAELDAVTDGWFSERMNSSR
jgi:hypothetical protein